MAEWWVYVLCAAALGVPFAYLGDWVAYLIYATLTALVVGFVWTAVTA